MSGVKQIDRYLAKLNCSEIPLTRRLKNPEISYEELENSGELTLDDMMSLVGR